MATTAARQIQVTFVGDTDASNVYSASTNTVSPASFQVLALTNGATTITPPAAGFTPQGVTIIPPAGNVAAITLKGVSGDTGVPLHLTDPTSIGLGSTSGTFVLVATTTINGVRLVWS